MHPTLNVPSAALGLVLLLIGAFWCWHWRRKTDPEERGAWPFGLVLAGGGLIAILAWRTIPWPTYGFMMMLGCLTVTVLTVRWATQRKLLTMEQTLELLVIAGVCGLIGARGVFLVEQWDVHFADKPPILRTAKLGEPLAKGDALRLRVHGGQELTVEFQGDETTLERVRDRIVEQAGPHDVTARILTTQHRGVDGLELTERGLLLETGRRGVGTSLVVLNADGAARKLGPIRGPENGVHVPWTKVFDLRMGGLTYFGSVFGILLSSFIYLRWRKVSFLRMLDVVAPVLPLGLFFGRMGCLSRSCCWGRELGADGALGGLSFPPWSLPWRQMVDERLGCNADIPLSQGADLASRGMELTPEVNEVLAGLGPLATGTPPLHAAQLYEGLACIAIFALVWTFRAKFQTRVGQVFGVLVLLQAPVRFVVEHFRRDHDVFLPLFGYLLTESQSVAILMVLGAIGYLTWLHRRGEPVEGAPEPAAEPAPEAASETAAEPPAAAAEPA